MLALAGLATRVSSQQAPATVGLARSGALSVSGVVLDPSGNAVADVAVSQVEHGQAVHTVRTGADGFFELNRLPRGAVDVEFRKIGFKLRTMTIDVQSGTDPLQLVLAPAVTHLDTMIVLAEHHVPSRLVGFYSRAKEGFGTFFDETAINKYGVTEMTKVLTRARGVFTHYQRTSFGAGDFVYMMGGAGAPCPPTFMIDGVRLRPPVLIDREVPLNNVAAVEVYSHPSEVPVELVPNPGSCGVVAIWTK